MSFNKIELLYFKNIIGNKKTIEQILKYCRNNNMCNKNKNYLCTHILHIYDYKINNNLKEYSCLIFKELLYYAKLSQNYTSNYIKISPELLSKAIINGSDILFEFLEYNFLNIDKNDIEKRIELQNSSIQNILFNNSDMYKSTIIDNNFFN